MKKEVSGMFEGNMLKLLIRLAVPIFIGMLFNFLFTLVDTFFISHINSEDPSIIGGVGLTFPIVFFALALSNGLMVGISSLVARSIGSKDKKTLNKTVESAFFLALLIAFTLLLPAIFFIKPLVQIMASQKALAFAENGANYLIWILPSMFFMLISYVLVGIFQGEGRPKYMMISMMCATTINIILDPILIYKGIHIDLFFPFFHAQGIRYGITGAAIATSIAQAVGCLVLMALFFKGKSSMNIKLKVKNISFPVILEILKTGFPMFLSQATMAFSIILYNKILISQNTIAVSAFTLVGRMDQIVLIPIIALSSAIITVVGQNYGRGNILRIKKAWRTGVITGGITVLVVATIHVLLAPFIYSRFSNHNQEITQMAVTQVRIMEFSFLGAVFGIQGRGVFQGLGKPLPGVILTILRSLIFGMLFILIFVYLFGMGTTGVYLGIVCGNLLISVVAVLWIEMTLKKIQTEIVLGENNEC